MTVYASGLSKGSYVGNGAFNEVFECTDPVHGTVAGKFIYPSKFPSWTAWFSAKSNAIMEAQSLSELEHPNILRVHSVLADPDDKEFLIVCEFCGEGSAADICKSNLIDLATAKSVARDAAMGLSYIHGRGYLHRDIKPGNILLKDGGLVKVGDFGFVTDQLMFGFAIPCGSPVYWAPEVFGSHVCSQQSDVFSLGASLLHLLSGDAWFFGNSLQPLILTDQNGHKFLRQRPLFLPHVPKSWRAKVNKLMHHDPTKRAASMSEALDLISRLENAEGWLCSVKPDIISWQLRKGARCVRVEWKDWMNKSSEWLAWSENLAGSGRRTLARSSGKAPWKVSYKSLKNFFETRNQRLR